MPGVDPAKFPRSEEPAAPPLKVAVVSRMIQPKGIVEAVEAVRRARAAGAPVELHLFGDPDPDNPRSIPQATLERWSKEPGITWHGRVADVAQVWRQHHVAMLLSYREGLPRSLVEAAAAGRPIVATDVAGCREVVRDGQEGILVPLGDIDAAGAGARRRLPPIRTCAIGWVPQRTHAFMSGLPPTPSGKRCEIFTSRWRRLHDPR